jgi:hypothetical protein
MALRMKNKLGFIDGFVCPPATDDPKYGVWDRCNTTVCSWILNSLASDILSSILWMDTAYDKWQDLKNRYWQGDLFRITELQKAIYSHREGDQTATQYFTHLKGLWQELDNFRPIPSCSCTVRCNCALIPTIKQYRDSDYVVRFLKGLNDQYAQVRSNIMLMRPLPNVDIVFSLLCQQERQFLLPTQEPHIIASVSDSNKSKGRGKGFQKGSSSSSQGKTGQGHGPSKTCSFCHKTGHTIDVCFKKNGYPKKDAAVNNCNVDNSVVDGEDTDDTRSNFNSSPPALTFPPEQHNAILELLQQTSHAANQITSNKVQHTGNSGNICLVTSKGKVTRWVLDTDATDHVCHDVRLFQFFKKIRPITIKLPYGSSLISSISGTVYFSKDLYLNDFLYLPSFHINLVSVIKLTRHLGCQLIIDSSSCLIQDKASSKMIGAAEPFGELYMLPGPVSRLSFVNFVSSFDNVDNSV